VEAAVTEVRIGRQAENGFKRESYVRMQMEVNLQNKGKMLEVLIAQRQTNRTAPNQSHSAKNVSRGIRRTSIVRRLFVLSRRCSTYFSPLISDVW